MARQRTYSDEERAAIVRSYLDQEEEKSMSQVAAEQGVAPSVLSVWVRKARGLPVGPPRSSMSALPRPMPEDVDARAVPPDAPRVLRADDQAAVIAATGHLLIALSQALGCPKSGTPDNEGGPG